MSNFSDRSCLSNHRYQALTAFAVVFKAADRGSDGSDGFVLVSWKISFIMIVLIIMITIMVIMIRRIMIIMIIITKIVIILITLYRVGGLEHDFYFYIQLEISSSHVTNIFRGV